MNNKYLLTLFFISIITACGKSPDINEPGICDSYGVQERGIELGTLGKVFELSDSDIRTICGPSGWIDQFHAGCYKPQSDGTVDVYYRNGDNCTKIHEMCHVKHGPYHTDRYKKDVASNHPRPTCPP